MNRTSRRSNSKWLRSGLTLIFAAVVAAAPAAAQERLKISEKDARQNALVKPDPQYPPMASQLKITGKVTIEVRIDDNGNVEDCEPVVGNPVLTRAAINAANQWKFKPFTAASGQKSRAVTRLSFDLAP